MLLPYFYASDDIKPTTLKGRLRSQNNTFILLKNVFLEIPGICFLTPKHKIKTF